MIEEREMNKVKIALVDDHTIFRSGLKMILSGKSNYEVVIEADNGKSLLEQVKVITPNIVLLDISMPVLDGHKTALHLKKEYPDIKILVLSMLGDENYYYKMIHAGANGFVLKNSDVDELMRAIDEVNKGNNYFSQDFLKKMVLKINNPEIDSKLKLSDKEKEVLQFICNGYTNKEISEELCLSIKSIERYRNALLQKTHTRNTAQLVRDAIINKLIDL